MNTRTLTHTYVIKTERKMCNNEKEKGCREISEIVDVENDKNKMKED